MGRPKLLLPWRGKTILHGVLAAWTSSEVDQTVLVVHPQDDLPAQIGRDAGARVVVPKSAPVDMKASVQLALDFIRLRFRPGESDTWLVAPADMPNLSPIVIDAVLSRRHSTDAEVVVPIHGHRRGHPVAFSWRVAAEVRDLSRHVGINALLDRHAVLCEEVDDPAILEDVDTPGDYEGLS